MCMDDRLITRMREILSARDGERKGIHDAHGMHVLFGQAGIAPITLTAAAILAISAAKADMLQLRSSFVDGGLGDVFVSPSMCVHLVRIHSSIWSGATRMRMQTQETFVIVLPRGSDGDIMYEVSFYPCDGFLLPTAPMTIPSVDGGHQIPISAIANKARAVLEALECVRLCDELDAGDIIVCDGLLHSSDAIEGAALDRATEYARARRIGVVGFAKTSHLYTNTGDDALRCADRLACSCGHIGVPWLFYPIANRASESIPDPCIAKLHARSRHAFRFDVLGARSTHDIASLLAMQSCDAAFLGYPYPLALADRFARVSLREMQAMRCRLLAACKEKGAILDADLASLDAHDVLDAIG